MRAELVTGVTPRGPGLGHGRRHGRRSGGTAVPAAVVALAMVAILVLPGCDPGSPSEKVGVSPAPGGGFQVHVGLCSGERVVGVRLVVMNGVVVGDADNPVLWSIVSRTGSRQAVYQVGRTSPGFVSRVGLSPLPAGRELAAIVDTTLANGIPDTFHLDDLRPGQVWTEERNLGPREFAEESVRRCP